MEICWICGAKDQSQPGGHHFTFIRNYQFSLCHWCYEGNWDGYNPGLNDRIIAHLKAKELPIPARNDKDLFPRE
jgi:hypothetical protein